MDRFQKSRAGFTLIELLIVIAIIGILAAVVIIAVNPGRQLAQANNARRTSGANSILNALGQYAVDFAGSYPAEIDTTAGNRQVLGTAVSGCNIACATAGGSVTALAACIDLSSRLTPSYLTAIPTDPAGDATNTRYAVDRTTGTNPRVTVTACAPELGQIIEITR